MKQKESLWPGRFFYFNKGSSVIFEIFLNPYSDEKGGGVLAKYEL